MKSLLFLILGASLFLNFAIAGKKPELPLDIQVPKITIFYASTFDNICTNKTSYKIDPAWVQDLKNQLPTWKKLWNKEGVLLLNTTIKLTGILFEQKNFQTSLSLCSFPSISAPLIVNARYALRSFSDYPVSNSVFISTIYHELLHSYIDSFLPKKTPLLIKYKNETKGVLDHLHLLALEKAVYLQLGWKFKLKLIIAKDKSLPNNDYKRAWKIINKKEGYENFITELKSFGRKNRLYPNEI